MIMDIEEKKNRKNGNGERDCKRKKEYRKEKGDKKEKDYKTEKDDRIDRRFDIGVYFPVGYEYQMEIRLLQVWLIGSIICSFSFFYRYYLAYQKLFIYQPVTQKWALKDGVFMEKFSVLSDGIFQGFFLGFLFLGVLAFWHYWYYYQESKSIYLIRRLPDRWYCLKSCIYIPVIVGILFLVWIVVLNFLYFRFYIWVTPEQCIWQG